MLEAAENYFGWFNEPYGENQANISANDTVQHWDQFMSKVTELANAKGIPVDDIQIAGPSVGPGRAPMNWAEAFYLTDLSTGMDFDFIQIHSYSTQSGKCGCNYEQLRDELRNWIMFWQ